jgi:serine/threonine-protein kinase
MSRTPPGSQPGSNQPDTDRGAALVAGKYRLVALVGAGGMGSVYEARNTWTKRKVAIKFLRPDLTATRESVLRFAQEAQAATAIAHPNIVEVLDMGRDPEDGSLYIVQEFLAGEPLRNRTRHGIVPVFEAVDIILPIMGALCAAHSRGIVHRDIKPENIFLTDGPGSQVVPKLIDFGVSKVSGAGQMGLQTKSGQFIGTPRYMSPEQLRASKEIDGRADVYSIGVVLYEMVTGRCPYESDTIFNLVGAILKGKPPAPEKLNPSVPASFAALLMKALTPSLEARLGSMRDFANAILACPEVEDRTRPLKLAQRHKVALEPVAPAEDVGADDLPMDQLLTPVVSQPSLAIRHTNGPRAPVAAAAGTGAPAGRAGPAQATLDLGPSTADGVADRALHGPAMGPEGTLLTAPPPQAQPPRRRRGLGLVLGVVLALAAAGLGLYALTSRGSAGAPVPPPSASAPPPTTPPPPR